MFNEFMFQTYAFHQYQWPDTVEPSPGGDGVASCGRRLFSMSIAPRS